MSVFKNKDNTEIFVDCYCGCNNGIKFKIDKEDYGFYCVASYTNGNFFRDQNNLWKTICNKAKKIWAIIANKDYYYSEITMSENEFEEFVEYINKIDYHNDLTELYDELYEMQEMALRIKDERLEKEAEEIMNCNHTWRYLGDGETFATCSKCGVVRSTESTDNV